MPKPLTHDDGNPMAESHPVMRRAGFQRKYVDASLGEAIWLLCEAGWSEETAAQVLGEEYRSAFLRQDGSVTRQSWVELGQRLLKETRMENAGQIDLGGENHDA